MKKLTSIISMVLFSLFFIASVALATPIVDAGDFVKLISYNHVDNAGIMVFQVSDTQSGGNLVSPFTLDTFCIQDNVFLKDGTVYQVDKVSTTVGDLGPFVAGTGALNGAVDYLFSKYMDGAYNSEFTGGNGLNEQADFQKLLWSLQGSGAAFTSVGTPWATDLANWNGDTSLQHPWGTQVLNLVNLAGTTDVQNVLYRAVPEPATMLLLGFGLLGLGGLKRKLTK